MKRSNARRDIVEAARELIAERGFHATPMAEIAKKAKGQTNRRRGSTHRDLDPGRLWAENRDTDQARRSAQILLVSAVANTYLTLAADWKALNFVASTLEAQKSSYKDPETSESRTRIRTGPSPLLSKEIGIDAGMSMYRCAMDKNSQ